MHAHDKFKNANFIEKFIQELFFRLLTNDNNIIYKQEVDALKQEFLFKDCNSKEIDNRKKVYQILKYTLVYMGIV